ncbi:MAG: DUF4229 domain-containing protein [Mycobacteriales bacterium]
MKLHPAVSYTLARFALVAACAGLLYAVGFRSWLLVLLAVAISAPVSWFLLSRQRKDLAVRIQAHQERRRVEREELQAAMDEQEQTGS